MLGLLRHFKKNDRGNNQSLQAINLSLPVDKVRYVALDTELTGLYARKNSIVSIGALRMEGGRIEFGNFYYRVVEPETKLTGKSVVIHGITPSETAGCPAIERLLPEFIDYCKDSVIVGHFIHLDLTFINNELKKIGRQALNNPAVDTYKIYEWLNSHDSQFKDAGIKSQDNKDLLTLAKSFGIPATDAHNSLSDAFITAQIFQRLLSYMPKAGVRTLKDLLLIGKA
jgi:DNA polymerase-3 subunit epsilon